MLLLILAESALETIPPKLWKHPVIVKYVQKKGRHPNSIVLDRSYHHRAILFLKNPEKRGRPDIVHFTLLEALGSPLNKEGLLQIYVHTISDKVISVDPTTRLPRNYTRFVGLIEQLFEYGHVPPNGDPLLKIEDKTLQELIEELRPSRVIGFEVSGKPSTLKDVIATLKNEDKPAIIIGGFPHGSFREETRSLFNESFCIDKEILDASIIASRAIYEYEVMISLTEKRVSQI